jgi:hypothetical protein
MTTISQAVATREQGPGALVACGSVAGYARHRRLEEVPCQPCRDARAERQRRKRATAPGCTVADCHRRQSAREMCATHLSRLYRLGRLDLPSDAELFWSHVVEGLAPDHAPQLGPCWAWTGATGTKGYGKFSPHRGMHFTAHRWAYEQLRADIPEGLTLDHLCLRKTCVNPWHADPCPAAENTRRQHARTRSAA